eukprot:symbB.v1.2.037531.t1/scaffold5569.1/size25780/2
MRWSPRGRMSDGGHTPHPGVCVCRLCVPSVLREFDREKLGCHFDAPPTGFVRWGCERVLRWRSRRCAVAAAIASAFAKLLQELRTDGEGPARGAVAPKELLLALCKHCPIIAEQPWIQAFHRKPGMQQDAQEVMAFLLDALHEDLNRIRQRLPAAPRSVLADDLQKPEERLAAEAWFDHLQRHRSLVVDLCQGQLRSQVKCCECGCASVTFDPFLFLTLPLPSRLKRGRKVHIEEAIKAFCVEEKLDGTDAWRCPRCERRASAAKRLSLWGCRHTEDIFEFREPTWRLQQFIGQQGTSQLTQLATLLAAMWLGSAVGITLRYALYFVRVPEMLKEHLEINSPITSHLRLKEGLFFLENGISPYVGDTCHYPPLLLLFLNLLDQVSPLAHFTFLVLVDLATALLLRKLAVLYRQARQAAGGWAEASLGTSLADRAADIEAFRSWGRED